MKKSIRYISTLFLAVSFVLVSCQKETGANISTGDDSAFAGKALSLDPEQRQHAAQMLAMSLANHPDAYAQLNDVIAMVRSYGVDENIYVYDILHREHSKFIPAHLEIEELVNAINEAELLANCGVEGRPYFDNLQLYWPYHNDWDRVTSPVVVFEPETIDFTEITGFKFPMEYNPTIMENPAGIMLIDIDVQKMDYDENSYIIIKQAEFPYTHYPRFVDGEFTKDNITWIRPTDVIGLTGDWCYVDHVVGPDTLVKATAIGFQSSGNQHDSWFFGGGSEFALTMAHIKDDGTQKAYTYRFEMSRDDIDDERTIQFEGGFIFHPNWTRDGSEVYYRLFEEDAGGSSFDFNINLSYQGASVTVGLSGNTVDDEIATGYLYRDDYMNSCRSGNNGYDFSGETVFFKAELYQPSSI